MNLRTLGLSALLVAFGAMTTIVLVEHGYLGFFVLISANSATRLMGFDLVISLGLILTWMVIDARQRQTRVLPYAIVTLFFGAAGPLAYLIVREASRARQPATT